MTVQTKVKTKRYAVYTLIVFFAHILQNVVPVFPEILSVRPLLLVSVAVCISMFEGEIVGAIAGIIAGILWDTVTVTADGYNALFLMVACAICGVLLRIFMRNNIVTYLIMNSAITFVYLITYVLFFVSARGIDGAGAVFFIYYLPMGIYSLILMPMWYIFIRAVYRKFSYDYTAY